MRRVRLLALVLLALAGAATLAAGAAPPAGRWPARLAVLFALPFVAGVVASLLLPRSPQRVGRSVKVRGTSRFHLLILGALALDLGAVGVGHALGWATLGPGDATLAAWRRFAAPLALPFTLAVATLGTEWALHARLWSVGRRRGQEGEATGWALLCGVALALPALAPGLRGAADGYLVAALAVALAREAAALLLFRAGGLFVAGAYRGTLVAIEAFALGDARGLFRPSVGYAAAEPAFDLLRVAGAVAALGLVAAAARARADEVT